MPIDLRSVHSEVAEPAITGSITVPRGLSPAAKFLRYAGPGLLVSVGYMDPGNWATDIEAGSTFGYQLLFVVAFCNLAAILLQILSMRLGIVTRMDLARACRERYAPVPRTILWIFAELALIATDIAEVLGSALALHLLFGIPLWLGVVLTAFDTVAVLVLTKQGFRQIEAIILALILTIALCFVIQLAIVLPAAEGLVAGLVPSAIVITNTHALYLAVGILGATVMPHNLYLHSAIVRTRRPPEGELGVDEAIGFASIDTVVALLLAGLVNGAILILAAGAFDQTGHGTVDDLSTAYRLLEPITGVAAASILFGIALLASGQSATFTGTIAGQVVLDGFLNLRIPVWQRRLITRALALTPALIGVLSFGPDAVGDLLVLTQVVLSFQLPFALYPLIRMTSDRRLMGRYATNPAIAALAWLLFAIITSADLWLLQHLISMP